MIKKLDFAIQRNVAYKNIQQGKTDRSYFPYTGDGKKNMGYFWMGDVLENVAANHNGHKGLKSHPGPSKPKLMGVLLLQTTREGDLVVDPFHRSGTTGVVVRAYNRLYCVYGVKIY